MRKISRTVILLTLAGVGTAASLGGWLDWIKGLANWGSPNTEIASSRAHIYWHDTGLTEQNARRLADELRSRGFQVETERHRDPRPPNAAVIGSRVPAKDARAVLSDLPYEIHYLFGYGYPEAAGSDPEGKTIGIGYRSTHAMEGGDERLRPVAVLPDQIASLLAPDLSDAEFHERLGAILTRPCRGENPEMVAIASGRFSMGAPEDEKGRRANEGPLHGVSVVKPFPMSRCEITVGQFRAFVEDVGYVTEAEREGGEGCWGFEEAVGDFRPSADRNWKNPGFGQGFEQTDHHPVVCITWNDARAYARWLSLRTEKTYRLPSEAEWEYAVRAVRAIDTPKPTPRRHWGDDPENERICEFANGADRTSKARFSGRPTSDCEDGFVFTAPAASFRPNAFGLFDMPGNVWEWTADCWHGNYRNAPFDGSAWREEDGGDCSKRVVRGRSWYSEPADIRSASRHNFPVGEANNDAGFRLIRDLSSETSPQTNEP
uniref:Formylglycine-generating enzyme, required for sulfatase activity, contains SUMF1/FGE domain n=1 Tax=Candidatus Kentrum sp. SD TaxID=2126332 RepID=A0A450Y4F0_9GAMM|nr:MAG: Formylglycine-generating enzyme, required for sulfatase activity, contains SUMF1/FGE domain [Candidatus Kentron sp. SD]VFK38633.1 MAG: Formylglycine-generating enzyme, required for sulfatase activity, contains SUMF1/FGE domain [Candidatus Kentron sp. SD]